MAQLQFLPASAHFPIAVQTLRLGKSSRRFIGGLTSGPKPLRCYLMRCDFAHILIVRFHAIPMWL
jgi:hypothetical protein